MFMTRSLLLAATAGTLSSAAFGQALSFGGEAVDPVQIRMNQAGQVIGTGSYGQRVPGKTYDNYLFDTPSTFTTVYSSSIGANHRHDLDDISFNPGPWATQTTPYSISGISMGIRNVAANPPAATAVPVIRLRFYNRADVNFLGFTGTGSSQINPAATIVTTINLGLPAVFPANDLIQGFVYNLATPVSIPAGNYAIDARIIDNVTGNDLGTDSYRFCLTTTSQAAAVGTTPGNPAIVGFTDASVGFDANNDGTFVGSAPGGTTENRQYGFNFGTPTAFHNIGLDIAITGDIPVTTPTSTNLGAAADAGNNTTGTVSASQVSWYRFTLASDATDALLHFLDIDTEGSTGDVTIGLYDSAGALAGGNAQAGDNDSGSGTADQLTFGVGRRAAVGDGAQYDGRHGQLAAGTYYLAVAPAGSSFGAAFSVTASAGAGGAFQVHLHTNVNGAALAPSVIPLINGQDYGSIDPAASTVVPGAARNVGFRAVNWSKFVLPSAITSTSYLDIDYARASTQTTDGVAYIFNSAGDIVYFADDEGPGALPQFSIGMAGSRSYGTGGATPVPFDGNTPVGASAGLPAGTYYLAEALFATQDLAAIPGNDRFHVRGTSGSNLALVSDFFSGGTTGPVCGTADFNGDGDVGTDQDIEAFFRCLAGTCCATCFPGGADFNGDGDVGTDQDIEAFFRVLAGNPC